DKVLPSTLGYQRATWGGNPANPYDTRRSASLGSSSGSGVSVSANLVMASLGEETRASCRGPSNHNAIAHLATQIHDRIFRWRYWCRPLLRPYRDPLPHYRRLRQGTGRLEGRGRGLLRPARYLQHGAAIGRAEHSIRKSRDWKGRTR